MPTLDAESFDSIVCDPPYGLKFMGRAWDHGIPGVEFWEAALRVVKPGSHLVAFGGTRTHHRLMCAIEDAGWEIRDCLMWLYGTGFPKSHNGPWGGTALKPAWEPIILARKPFPSTVAANVLAHGTGALNIDGCRINFASADDKAAAAAAQRSCQDQNKGRTAYSDFNNGPASLAPYLAKMDAGRWPANVALDEEAAALLDEQSGNRPGCKSPSAATPQSKFRPGQGNYQPQGPIYGDNGGASRFFYCTKASRSERGEGNTHPTVKPLRLMQWLCRLVTPSSGLILDPFCGTGTTGLAAKKEGFRFVGIDTDPAYVAMARERERLHAE